MNQGLHPIGGISAKLGNDVRVGIHGQRDLRVAEDLHYDSGWDPLRKQQRRARVPQIMESTLIQVGLVQ